VTPPSYPTGNNTFYWSYGAYTDNWDTGGNWYNDGANNGSAPTSGADIVLGVMGLGSDPQTLHLHNKIQIIRSLWFGNEADYTLTTDAGSPNGLFVGDGLDDGGHLITVLDTDASANRVHTLDVMVFVQGGGDKTFNIGNYSPGTLLFKREFQAGGNSLILTNLGTLRFESALSGVKDLTITDSATTIFEGDVNTFGGVVTISDSQTTLFKKNLNNITGLTVANTGTTIFEGDANTDSGSVAISGAQTTIFKQNLNNTGLTVTDSDTTTFEGEVNTNNASLVISGSQTTTFKNDLNNIGGLAITDSDATTFEGEVNTNNAVLTVSGSQATHFKSNVNNVTSLTVIDSLLTQFHQKLVMGGTPSISVSGTSPDRLTTAIFANLSAQGTPATLTVGKDGHVIITDQPLNNTAAIVKDGGTLALRRSYVTAGWNPADPLTLSGGGVNRQYGTTNVGALYVSGPAGVEVLPEIRLDGDAAIGVAGSRLYDLRIRRAISEASDQGSSTFKKVSSGLLWFSESDDPAHLTSATNTWKGATELQRGVVRLKSLHGLPSGSLVFSGGILELGKHSSLDNFSRALGSGQGEVRWTGSGGFSAYEVDRSVSIGSGMLTWGSGGFVPVGSALLLNSRYATHQITLSNAINLGFGLREIRVERGLDNHPDNASAPSRGRLSGALSGTGGGIFKTGPGLLWLSGLANTQTYTGATFIRDGALGGNISSASNLQFDGGQGGTAPGTGGGLFGVQGDFTRALGSGADAVQWLSSGGFAAYGNADRYVRLGNSTDEIAWGAAHFVKAGHELRFGHYTAERAVIWDKVLNFGNAMRTIRLERGRTANTADVIFAQALKTSASTGGLRLVGDGRADLWANNAEFSSNLLEISGAELRLAKAAARLGTVGTIALREGGRLTLDNSDGTANSAQVAATTAITLNSGEIHYRAHASGAAPSIATLGAVTLESGANTIGLHRADGQPAEHRAQINIAALHRDAASRATLDLGAVGAPADATLVHSTESPAAHADGGIIPWATVTTLDADGWAHSDWARVDGNDIKRFTAYDNQNRHVSSNIAVSGSFNSLKATSSFTLSGPVTLSSGGLLATGGYDISVRGSGSLGTASQNRPLYIHSNLGNASASHRISFGGSTRFVGGMDLVKTGSSGLHYDSTGTSQIGSLYIHQGRVEITKGKIETSGQVYIGNGTGRAELALGPNLRDPLVNKPRVTLHGTTYGRGAEFGAGVDEAVLTLGQNTHQTLAELNIIDRGTLDFASSSASLPTLLFLDLLTFNNTSAQLFVRGWLEHETFLLVKRTAFAEGEWAQALKQIFYDGYSLDFNVVHIDYNADYFQIVPFGSGVPEPATYGAILGAVGLGLFAWRKQRQSRQSRQ